MCRTAQHALGAVRATMTLKTIINGIDVDRQRVSANLRAERRTSSIAARTEWMGGTQTRTAVSVAGSEPAPEFVVDADYPGALLGSGIAPSPLELLVAAVGSSFVSSLVLAAATEEVRIESLVVRAIAGIDVEASAQGRRAGGPVAAVELRADIDANASPADLERLAALALESSPVGALCRLSVRVQIEPVERGDSMPPGS